MRKQANGKAANLSLEKKSKKFDNLSEYKNSKAAPISPWLYLNIKI
jgi:hypothetical protein